MPRLPVGSDTQRYQPGSPSRRDESLCCGGVDASPSATTKRRELCTVVDWGYVPRAITLYRSLEAAGEDFRLFVFAAEAGISAVLDNLGLPRLVAVGAEELEHYDPALAATRADRSLPEYCQTAKPCVCLHALEAHAEIERITFIDADLLCLAPLQPLFQEIDASSTAFSPHRFSARWRYAERTHGAFNSGLVSFRRDPDGLAALQWWRERCLEWCYLRVEPHRYTDQVYLEHLHDRFAGVHVIQHTGVNQGPWNAEGRVWSRADGGVRVDGSPLLLFHFASLRLLRGRAVIDAAKLGERVGGLLPAIGQFRRLPGDETTAWSPFPGFRLSAAEVELLWMPYVTRLMEAAAELRTTGHDLGVWEYGWRDVGRDVLRGSAPAWMRQAVGAVRLREE